MKEKTKYLFVTGILLLCLFFPHSLLAQKNLVPNPGFEPIEKTPPSKDYNRKSEPQQLLVDGWYVPTAGTPDFYNSDRSTFLKGQSTKKARTGLGRVGLIINEKNGSAAEYIQAKLTEPLKKNAFYCVTIHYSLDKRCDYYATHIGACFTAQAPGSKGTNSLYRHSLSENVVLLGNDQENVKKTGWQQARQIYQAMGDEEYLTIGNFEPSYALDVTDDDPVHHPEKGKGIFGRLAYYYLDDISVVELMADTVCTPEVEPTPAANHFVFLVDASASMVKAGYLEQMKSTLVNFTDTLGKNDLVSVLAFDVRTRVVLQKVRAAEKEKIVTAVNSIEPGTVTNIDKALTVTYQLVDSVKLANGNNRVILVSDAQFELSSTSRQAIMDHWKNENVFFSMIQFGEKRNKTLEKISAKTNGVYTHAKKENILRALSVQVQKPGADEYTPSRVKSTKGFLPFDPVNR